MYIASMTYGYRFFHVPQLEGHLTREFGQDDVMVEVGHDMLLEAARKVKMPMDSLIVLKFDIRVAKTQAKS